MSAVAASLAVVYLALLVVTVRTLPPLHPAQVWSGAWAAGTSLYALQLLPYTIMSPRTAALAAFAGLAFIGGSLAGEAAGARRKPVREGWSSADRRVVELAAGIAAAVTVLLLAAFEYQVVDTYGLRAAVVTSPDVRLAIGAGFAAVTIKYLYFAISASALAALAAGIAVTPSARRRWIMVAGASVASAYFSTGRGTILLMCVVASTVYLLVRPPRIGLRRLAALGIGFLGLAVLLIVLGGAIIGKTFQNSELAQVPSIFVDRPELSLLALPYAYLSAPVASLEIEVRRAEPWGRAHGCATVAPACKILQFAGVEQARPEPEIRPFTPPPIRWNTYTALDKALIDGGTTLAVPIVLMLGVFSGWVWALARRRFIAGLAAYGIVASAVAFSGGQNNFFAPHILGALLISIALVEIAKVVGGRAPLCFRRSGLGLPDTGVRGSGPSWRARRGSAPPAGRPHP